MGGGVARAQDVATGGAVRIEIEQFGFGDALRPGEWAGIRVRLTDTVPTPREVVVRMHTRDDDGDTRLDQRIVVLNGSQPVATWLNAHMPWQLDRSTTFVFSVHEYRADVGAVGRQLAVTRLGPGNRAPGVVSASQPLIGVVGRRLYGLSAYEMRLGGQPLPAHAHPEVVEGLPISAFPSDWVGLRQYDTIVWTDGEPGDLGTRDDPSVHALREWIERGGHLVVVLPVVGGTWLTSANPLWDPEDGGIMPFVEIERLDDAPMEPYRGLVTRGMYDDQDLPDRSVVQLLHPIDPDAGPDSAMCLLAGPDGCVVARRLVGNGMVTLVGVDLAHPLLAQGGVLRADAFWHRILGQRFDLPLANNAIGMSGSATGEWADRYLASEINWTASSGLGLLVALIVFGAYWIVAGPGGFALLKANKLSRHAWVAFVATTAVFTLVAWAGATAMKENEVRARHFTVVDQVYGRGVQRARTWASVLLPSYGDVTLTMGDPEEATPYNALLTTWSDGDSGTAQPFPDARPYTRDSRHLEEMTLPARATVKTVHADWFGPVRWRMPHAIAPGWAPRLDKPLSDEPWELFGKIKHELPGPLEDVEMVLITRQLTQEEERERRFEDEALSVMLSHAYSIKLQGNWDPGAEIDLASLTSSFMGAPIDRRFEKLVLQDSMWGTGSPDSSSLNGEEIDAYMRLSFTGMLPPPITKRSTNRNLRPALRRAAHGLDLSHWSTQPCLIVTGHVDNVAMPEPLRYGSGANPRPIRSEGRVLIRWVYPLAPEAVTFTEMPRDKAEVDRRKLLGKNK